MGPGKERARTASKSNKVFSSNKVTRPKLLLSAALAALIVAAPASDQASAQMGQMQMMSVRPNFGGAGAVNGGGPITGGGAVMGGGNLGGVHLNGGSQSYIPSGHVGHIPLGDVGVVGRGDPGRGISGDPCELGRGKLRRCGTGKGNGNVVVITGGGDRPGGGDDNPRHPHEPIWPHRPHWVYPPDPIVAVNPPVVVTQPASPGNGSAPQASRRSSTGVPSTKGTL